MAVYTGIVHKDAGSDYGVHFPDLPGCFSAGSDMDDLIQMATRAVAFHVDGLARDGDAVPAPRAVADLMTDPEVKEDLAAGATLIQVPLLSRARARRRVEVQMDQHLLDAIDRRAKALGITRTAFLHEAAERLLLDAG
ncbi:type II toxin-antitoxin system HicB family antitoxin [Eilatimonas milleporae]|uniref:Putative RNase H-like HicB family nuclease n=1 Tax=Eilatimonas milleporae TaxID=911205 RepID=A0A3M0CR01_9PROT|nr:type II toxin-antitoxin system HicB family antitoxin [Eilatimonas milleporae]RMB11922.1 putative RNase H-like HicB family nuclease [Eilatimonas milleporae]